MNKHKYTVLSQAPKTNQSFKEKDSEILNSVQNIKKFYETPEKITTNEYKLKVLEGKMRREKALSYAESIKKPNFRMSTVHELSFEEDRLHDPSPQNQLLQKQVSRIFEY